MPASLVLLAIATGCSLVEAQTTAVTASDQVVEAADEVRGVRVYRVRSPYQAGETVVKVLPPEVIEPGRRYRTLYVLPVEPGEGTVWGDALAEVRAQNLHNRHGLICVYPTFAHMPWYADHPTDPQIRQESYLLRVVMPLVESRWPVVEGREGRLLVGFSKSGWGAYSLLLRHPDLFSRAAAWDAPLTELRPERFGMGPIFGGQVNFEEYRITALLERRAATLAGGPPRLVLTGYGNFREAHVAAHEQMADLGIPHVYRDGPPRKHHWQSGWLAEAVELLVK